MFVLLSLVLQHISFRGVTKLEVDTVGSVCRCLLILIFGIILSSHMGVLVAVNLKWGVKLQKVLIVVSVYLMLNLLEVASLMISTTLLRAP